MIRNLTIWSVLLTSLGCATAQHSGISPDRPALTGSEPYDTKRIASAPVATRESDTHLQLTAAADGSFIVVREDNFNDTWPERFRSTDMPLDLGSDELTGLRDLRIMGGGQPSEQQLRNIVDRSAYPVIVLDLRQEPHAYIDGMPITWFRPYVSDRELGTDAMISMEGDFIEYLRGAARVQVDSVEWTGGQDYELKSSEYVDSKTVRTNAEMVESAGARYIRLHVPVIPNELQVRAFESLVEEIASDDVSLYVHCWDGTGRSTEFMVMYDILKNGRKVSLETIARRHAALGGIDVLALPSEDSPNYARSVLRRNFILDYYRRKSKPD